MPRSPRPGTGRDGWFTILAKPMFWLLTSCAARIVEGTGAGPSCCWCCCSRLPSSGSTAASYADGAMKAINPKLMQLRERYGDTGQMLNQAMECASAGEKINPLGGCLLRRVADPRVHLRCTGCAVGR